MAIGLHISSAMLTGLPTQDVMISPTLQNRLPPTEPIFKTVEHVVRKLQSPAIE
jgi:hypothetical protein